MQMLTDGPIRTRTEGAILEVTLDRPKALAMATAARAVGRTDATDRVADACLEAAERKP